jgi:tetratricopeptide (TPR) repeat protein
VLASLLLLTALADPPGYKPPVLIGVQGEGKGLRARPITFPAAGEEWVRARSTHFMIISSAGEKRTREMAEGLETLAAALMKLEPSVVKTAPTPTRVLVFTRRKEVQPYFDYLLNRENAHASGVFVSQAAGGSMVIDAGWGATAQMDHTPFHELVHSLMESGSDARPPLWIEEGLAEYFSSAEMRSGSLFVGAPIKKHVDVLRREKLIPLAQLFAVVRESDMYNVPSGQSMYYAESWAAVDALMRVNRTAFIDFMHDIAHGTAVDAALQAHFKMTATELEKRLRTYGGMFFRATYGASVTVPDVDKSMTIAHLDRADLLFELGHFLQGLSNDSGEAARHFNAALAIDPKHARSLAALGRYEEAIAADPKDAEIFLAYAESLLGTSLGPLAETGEPYESDTPKFRKAREVAMSALALGGDEARARGDFGTSFIIEKDDALAPGIEALQKAHALDPSRTDFALHLFAMLRRTGDRAEPLLAQLSTSRSKQVAFATRAIVVHGELARANALAHSNKLDDAAAVLRDLAKQTDDVSARNDLIKQAADFEHVAETNGQIMMYNEAVGQVNAGKYSAARKILTALLAKTNDPNLVRDATSLKKQLEGRKDLR